MLHFNYGEYVFQQLITTEFIQHKLAQILISLAVNFINLHIVTLLCTIISINVYIDFFIQITISVIMALRIDIIYNFVERYEKEFYALTQYLINNYSIDNYLYWKRIIVISACIYACIALLIITFTNGVLFIYIIQYTICFLIIEQFEQQRIQTWIRDYQTRPIGKRFTDDPASDLLINSYLSPRSNVLRPRRRSAPTRERPIVRINEPDAFYLIGNNSSGSISTGIDNLNFRQGVSGQIAPPRSRQSTLQRRSVRRTSDVQPDKAL